MKKQPKRKPAKVKPYRPTYLPPDVVKTIVSAFSGDLTLAEPGWWAVHEPTGAIEFIGGDQGRWFDARFEAVKRLSAKLGQAVSQDALRLEWGDRKPEWAPMVAESRVCEAKVEMCGC